MSIQWNIIQPLKKGKFWHSLQHGWILRTWGLPCDSDGIESSCSAGDLSSIPGSGEIPWRREWQLTPVFLPGEFHRQRNLVGYRQSGHKESDLAKYNKANKQQQQMLHELNRTVLFRRTVNRRTSTVWALEFPAAAAAAKSLQSCPTLCDPIDGSPLGSPVPGILQARTLEWAAISFSSAWKWKVKGKLLSPVRPFAIPWTAAHKAPPSMGLSRQEYWSGVPLPSPIRVYIHIYIKLDHFAEQQKLIQHCKSTIFQFKNSANPPKKEKWLRW